MTSSAFLLGPRGTGKSTWIKHNFPNSISNDLLNTSEIIRFSRQPSLLYEETSHLAPKTWVVIDEIQKVPGLLNEIHRIIEKKGLFFILSGSSARKLRRSGVNLLAGKAVTFHLSPFVSKEVAFNFFFDTGVVRALSGRLAYPPLPEELGTLLETFIVNELCAYLHYNDFWNTPYIIGEATVERQVKVGGVNVLPAMRFLKLLWDNQVIQ